MSAEWPHLSSSHLVCVSSFLSRALIWPLASKYLYNFSPTKPQQRIDLEQTDETGPLCCQEVPKDSNYRSRYQHHLECHKLSYENIRARNEKDGRSTPPMKKCRTRYSWNSTAGSHCGCFLKRGRLHYRLNGWIGKGLGYCGTCQRFTKRKPQHKGRCKSIFGVRMVWAPADGHRPRLSRQIQTKSLWRESMDACFETRRIWQESVEEVVQ